ncbi:amino acid ABC transporter permease [Stutzerimonas azotifigens]|uniref:amino acid ABC transporter permease n=1 Tax=Stutzerimonas azotifigens TaxID=291995 RepID=UPI000401ACCA|nr:amino acid ABC transporter permease [Stutzerimonas azotifigens]
MSEWAIVWEARGAILDGFYNTLILFGLSVTLAFVLGCAFAYWLETRNPATLALRGFINCMRMLPFLILAYLLYYGLPSLGLRLNAWTAGLIALVVYYGAYFGEVLRGARLVLPEGQVEAAKAHGFTGFKVFRRIVLPQLIIKTRPLMGNLLILCLKDTAFLTIITVQELTAAANSVQSTYFVPMEAFVVVILLYWLISICLELALKWAGRFGAKRGFEHV